MRKNGSFINCTTCKKSIYRNKWQLSNLKHHFCSRICYHSFYKGRQNLKHSEKLKEGFVSGRLKSWLSGLTVKDERVRKVVDNLNKNNKGKKPWNFKLKGVHVSTRKGKTYEEFYGKEKGKELKKKNNIWKNKSKNERKIISDSISNTLIKKYRNGELVHLLKGKKHTNEARKKMRISHKRYLENMYNKGLPISPMIGKFEFEIINNIEKCIFPYKFIRQHPVIGYFLDGYCSALNLAIEVDEPAHKKHKERDRMREEEIKKELNCSFLRIEIPRGVM